MELIQLSPSERRVIRFALGTEEKPTSSVWRLWTTRRDAYLIYSPRHDVKCSMHGEKWKIDFGHKRHNFRPVHFSSTPGWALGPAILFAHVPYRPMDPPESLRRIYEKKNLLWFDMPPEWYMSEFSVFFADNTLDRDQLPPPDPTVDVQQFAVGPLPLTDGRQVWLRHLVKPIPDDRKEYLLKLKETLRGLQVDKTSEDLRALGLLIHVAGSRLVTVPFGLEIIQTLDP